MPPFEQVFEAAMSDLADERTKFHEALLDEGWLLKTEGLSGYSESFESLVRAIRRDYLALVTGHAIPLTFPPVVSASMLDRTGYAGLFPNFVGVIDVLNHSPSRPGLRTASAACHPLYSHLEGTTVSGLELYQLEGWCFRYEPSLDPARLVSFRMLEVVAVSDHDTVTAHRDTFLARTLEMLEGYGVPAKLVLATDPFFGRGSALLAAAQEKSSAKYELVAPLYSSADGYDGTALASGNTHGTHFTSEFSIRLASGAEAASACVALGLERSAFAVIHALGADKSGWPKRALDKLDQGS